MRVLPFLDDIRGRQPICAGNEAFLSDFDTACPYIALYAGIGPALRRLVARFWDGLLALESLCTAKIFSSLSEVFNLYIHLVFSSYLVREKLDFATLCTFFLRFRIGRFDAHLLIVIFFQNRFPRLYARAWHIVALF